MADNLRADFDQPDHQQSDEANPPLNRTQNSPKSFNDGYRIWRTAAVGATHGELPLSALLLKNGVAQRNVDAEKLG